MGQVVSQYKHVVTNCCDTRPSQIPTPAPPRDPFPSGISDYRKFEQARYSADLPALVALLSSAEKLPKAYRSASVHPWAKSPETVGALVLAHLAVLISADNQSATPQTLVDLGLVQALVQFLESEAQDRMHAAAVASVFLSEKNSRACTEFRDLHAADLIFQIINTSPGTGLQLTLLSFLRNLVKEAPELLVQVGDRTASVLISILNSQLARRQTPQAMDFILECLQIISDLVRTSKDVCKPLFANDRVRLMLESTKSSQDIDVSEESHRLLALL